MGIFLLVVTTYNSILLLWPMAFHVLWKLQVDIIRPWRLLLEKVERTLRVLLRDSLLTSADDTEVVLRAWSHFLLTYKPKCLGEDGKGVTIEIVNKLEAVLLLMQRLNSKINSYSKAGMIYLAYTWHLVSFYRNACKCHVIFLIPYSDYYLRLECSL